MNTLQSIINELRNKTTFTALDNQVAKFSVSEMKMYAEFLNDGMSKENALSKVILK